MDPRTRPCLPLKTSSAQAKSNCFVCNSPYANSALRVVKTWFLPHTWRISAVARSRHSLTKKLNQVILPALKFFCLVANGQSCIHAQWLRAHRR